MFGDRPDSLTDRPMNAQPKPHITPSRDVARSNGPNWAWWLGGAAVTWSLLAVGGMAAFAGYEASVPTTARAARPHADAPNAGMASSGAGAAPEGAK